MSVDRAVVRRAVFDALPLFVPAIPFALVLGLAITESGIDTFVGWSSSWLVFGGAAQLTLIILLGSGAAVAAAVGAALVVQARHSRSRSCSLFPNRTGLLVGSSIGG